MKRNILIIAAIVLAAETASAQSMQFLNSFSDASSLGVAGASVALDANAYAPQNNAASMALYEGKMSAALSYGMLQPDYMNSQMLSLSGFGKVNDKLSVGAFGSYFIEQPYSIIGAEGSPIGQFTPGEFFFGLSGSYKINSSLSAGLNVKIASQSLAESNSAMGLCADLSVFYKKEGVKAGLSINNLGPGVDFGTGYNSLPALVRAGAAYTISGFTGNAELAYVFAGGFMGGLGAEYCLADIVSARVGYHFGSGAAAIASFVSFGLGVKFAGVNLNAAYLLGSESLSNTMLITLGYAF